MDGLQVKYLKAKPGVRHGDTHLQASWGQEDQFKARLSLVPNLRLTQALGDTVLKETKFTIGDGKMAHQVKRCLLLSFMTGVQSLGPYGRKNRLPSHICTTPNTSKINVQFKR